MSIDQNSVQTVLLPALGESVTEGTVTRWLKKVGDPVAAEEALLEVSTDKVDTEIPAPAAGILTEILVGEDEVVEVGARLATITAGGANGNGATVSDAPDPSHASAPAPSTVPTIAPSTAPASPAASSQPVRAHRQSRPPAEHITQVVRRLATQHRVDLSAVTGTGLGGRVRKQDVLEAATTPQVSPTVPSHESSPTVTMAPPRRTNAPGIAEPLQTSAQATSVFEVDVTDVMNARQRAATGFARTDGGDLSVTAFLAKACVDALKAYPMLNASIDADNQAIVQHDSVNLAVAEDSPRGLVAPVIAEAGDLSVVGLARRINDLVERTRAGQVTADELASATFTLTTTGSRGALFDTPVINRPQVAILASGAVVRRPVVMYNERLGETFAIRSMSYLALTYDHRFIDGADATGFLTDVRDRLEQAQFDL
jgi:pyruvate dehydrogenase E2 component (dihydrolipoamide acetyltransferase)